MHLLESNLALPALRWLWVGCWQGAGVLAMVVLSRWVFRGMISARWRHLLWFVVLVKLIAPMGPSSRWSVFNLPGWVGGIFARNGVLPASVERGLVGKNGKSGNAPMTGPAVREVDGGGSDAMASRGASVGVSTDVANSGISGADDLTGSLPRASSSVNWRDLGIVAIFGMWLTGAMLAMGVVLRANIRFWKRLGLGGMSADMGIQGILNDCRAEMGIGRAVPVVVTDAVSSPALAGWWNPRILMPARLAGELDEKELRMVFLHELAHVRGADVLMEMVWTVVQAAYWFNPLVWWARKEWRGDRELARDAMVLGVIGAEEAERYGKVLIRLIERVTVNGRGAGVVAMADTHRGCKERIAMIAKYDGTRSGSNWISVGLMLVIGAIALSGAKAQEGARSVPPTGLSQAATRGSEGVIVHSDRPERIIPSADDLKILDARLHEVEFENEQFEIIVRNMGESIGANVRITDSAMKSIGIDPRQKIAIKFDDVSLGQAIDALLTKAGAKDKVIFVPMPFPKEAREVLIGMPADFELVTRIYDVRDLARPIAANGRETVNLLGVPIGDSAGSKNTTLFVEAACKDLAEKIQNLVEFETWKAWGRIEVQDGKLMIRQTHEAHEEIAQLLEQMRATTRARIETQARFIAVDSANKKLIEQLAAIGKTSAQKLPSSSLSAAETEALLKMVEGAGGAEVWKLSAEMRSGQSAYCRSASDFQYVARVEKDRTEKSGYKPMVEGFSCGTLMNMLRGVVSADGKYVTLDVDAEWVRLEWVRTIVDKSDANLNYQQPIVSLSEIIARVTLDNGGSLLLELGEPGVCVLENRTGTARMHPAEADVKRQVADEPKVYLLLQPSIRAQ